MKRVLLLGAMVLSACGTAAVPKPASITRTPTPALTASPTATPLPSPTTAVLPLGRWAAAMAYDEARHNVLLFGGTGGDVPFDDTWTWDGTNWTHHQGLTSAPPARQGAAIAYDEATQQVILFGGMGTDGAMNDTWAWNGSAWQQLYPNHSPSKREGSSAVYDPALGVIVLFGGMDDSTAMPSPINDTWTWNGSDWTQMKVLSPAGGVRPRLAFLTGANLVERFGDCQLSHDNRIYGFDGHGWAAKSVSGSSPPALCMPSLVGDADRHVLVMFGGNPGNGLAPVPADTWTYSGSAWTRATPATSPPARYEASMVYDRDQQAMVLFGGEGLNQGQTGPLNDTWTWDGSNWTPHQ